ncbi:pyruvate dehydrogenase E1 component alpha subunit [Tersicoccus solisilvae]|uniref:2-oxoisovalerate dehydrogenase subunit alpha n=1 Tax=Tersicoccus solisilvae TaxID=1882339 RepID=A0ABQ1PMD6_9MICC|nr:thiamine pyrophosphate-dependent enzyme [Tersicoccus solisilvae]GGC99332.1 pyruvate dehydrogenase E1 component alpha subunit [Tersicoccus solisilvae]
MSVNSLILDALNQGGQLVDDLVQLITPTGERRANPAFDALVDDIDADALAAFFVDMTVIRRLDTEATALQRQGELGLWPPLTGQEAAQIGSGRALAPRDMIFPSYREHGVAYCRGVDPVDILRLWRGAASCGWDPTQTHMATPQIVIGAQTLHATGYAMGIAADGGDEAAIVYFGDGATSQGDVNEAMVFAASFGAPLVFFCQNNQWAISEPVRLQARGHIADRAPGFGIPSVRVDGNDVLAVTAVTRKALARARAGEGPSYIEAVTYRMGPHTTADDPTRYEDRGLRAEWEGRDPLTRVRALLAAEGYDVDDLDARAARAADDAAAGLRSGITSMPDPAPETLFEHVLSTPDAWLEDQRDRYLLYLDSLHGDAGSGHGASPSAASDGARA